MSDERVSPRSHKFSRDGKKIYCIPGDDRTCNPDHLLHRTPEPGSFHDEILEQATFKINDILDEVKSTEPDRELAIITTPDGLLLVWVSEGDEVDVLS